MRLRFWGNGLWNSKPTPDQGAPSRCCHRAIPIASASPGQGGRERLHWAFDGSTVAAMSGELRALIDDPESQAWLATKVIALANDCFQTGDQAVDGDSRRAAASIHAETADPLHTALSDCLEKHDGPDGVTGEEIKERLKSYSDVPKYIAPRTFGGAMQTVFGVTSTSLSRQGVNKKGYRGLRLTAAPGVSFHYDDLL